MGDVSDIDCKLIDRSFTVHVADAGRSSSTVPLSNNLLLVLTLEVDDKTDVMLTIGAAALSTLTVTEAVADRVAPASDTCKVNTDIVDDEEEISAQAER